MVLLIFKLWYRADNGICGNSGLPISMIPCLHQSNVHIKRKLRVCRAQKCNLLVGAKTVPTSMTLQTTPFGAAQYRTANGNFWKFWSTNRHGIVFTQTQCLYQKKATGMESGVKTIPTCTRPHTTLFYAAWCLAVNENLRKLGSTYHHGTVFAPKQCLYQKTGTGMKSPKM